MTGGWVLGPLLSLSPERETSELWPFSQFNGALQAKRSCLALFFVLSCLRACYLLVAEDFLGIIPKGRDVKCMPNLLFLLKGEILGQVDLSWHQTVPTWGRD